MATGDESEITDKSIKATFTNSYMNSGIILPFTGGKEVSLVGLIALLAGTIFYLIKNTILVSRSRSTH